MSESKLPNKVPEKNEVKRVTKRKDRFWIALSLCTVLSILILLYEWLFGSFEWSYAILLFGILVVAVIIKLSGTVRIIKWLISLVGIEEENQIVTFLGFFGGILLSIYLLISDPNKSVPPALQFSIVPITATLAGLVVASSNHKDALPQQKLELLRVAQKLIIVTVCFIFFAIFYFLAGVGGNYPDINNWPSGDTEIIKWISEWLAIALFFSGTSLFVIGIIDLGLGVKHLKENIINKEKLR
jgi:hypothetical protein